MKRCLILPSTKWDVFSLAPNLREKDKEELKALGYENYKEPILKGVLGEGIAFTMFSPEREVITIFGVYPTPNIREERLGAIWLLASPLIDKYKKSFLSICEEYITKMSEGYDILFNIVDSRNTRHLKWLKWCGFTLLDDYYINDVKFIKFMKEV